MASVKINIFAVVLMAMFSGLSAKISPDYIKICPGLKSECLKSNIQETIPHFVKGVPSLGLNSTDPLHIDYLKIDLPGDLKIEFYNGVITGLRNCVVDNASYNNFEGTLDIHCNILIKGKYRATGKIILFTINGDGDAKIKANNVSLKTKILFEDKVRNGVEYREIKNIKSNYNFGDKITFGLTNLFKGNPQLSETILNFINENWEQVVEEFGRPVVDAVIRISMETVKKLFKVIPKNELIA